MITEMRGADLNVFEFIKTVKFVIQCGFKKFSNMVVNSLADFFFF